MTFSSSPFRLQTRQLLHFWLVAWTAVAAKDQNKCYSLGSFKRTVFKASKETIDNKSLSERENEKRVIILLKNERLSFAFLFNKVIF